MIDSIARVLEAPPPGWRDLMLEDTNAVPAHRPELWKELCRAQAGWRPVFLAVERDRDLVGGAALILERRAGHHWIHAMPFALSGAPLARAGCHAAVDAAVGRALGALQVERSAVGGLWAVYRPAGPPPDPAAFDAISGETRMLETSNLDLEAGAEAVWRRFSPDARAELRRAAERGLTCGEDPGALEWIYALYLAQARGWPRYRPVPLELSRRLLARAHPAVAADPPLARLFTVRDRRGPVYGMLLLDHAHEIFGWWSGAHGGPRGRSAMPLLVWSVARWAAEAGRLRFNLGGSLGRATLAAFKRALGARPCAYPARWLDARRGPWTARLLSALQARWRHGRFRGERA